MNHFRFTTGLVSTALLLAVSPQAQAVEYIAHRGASYDAPENTLAAVKLAWKQHADAVEIDIHLSKDGRIVVMHDGTTKRTGGVDKKIADQNFKELRKLDVGRWKGAAFAGEKLPTLQALIDTIPEGKRLFIEIKDGPEIIPVLRRTLQKSGKSDSRFAIISFSLPVLQAARQKLPTIDTYWLTSLPTDETTTPTMFIERAKAAGIQGLNLNHNGPVDAAFIQQTKAAGLRCYVWTIDAPKFAQRYATQGVDGITTNRPAWLREHVDLISAATLKAK